MTDLSLINEQFIILTGYSRQEAESYSPLLEQQAEYICARLKNQEYENNSQVVFLCAVRAYYILLLSDANGCVASFKAGDVSFSRDGDSEKENVRLLYEFALNQCGEYLSSDSFAFFAV